MNDDNCDILAKYINFPIEVFGFNIDKRPFLIDGFLENGTIVKVKLQGEDIEYYGIYLGQIVNDIILTHKAVSKELNISSQYIDLIFIPDLKKTITGDKCWFVGYDEVNKKLEEGVNDEC